VVVVRDASDPVNGWDEDLRVLLGLLAEVMADEDARWLDDQTAKARSAWVRHREFMTWWEAPG
jgi:hypothetical protein